LATPNLASVIKIPRKAIGMTFAIAMACRIRGAYDQAQYG